MERDFLYERPVKHDTETPRECQIRAMYHTFMNEPIPADVYEAVLQSSERNRALVKQSMDTINSTAGTEMGEMMMKLSMMALAGAIAGSSGINGPKAARRRLDHLGRYFESYVYSQLLGPTE